ncbi:hypothetical protein K7X08_004685 [Anisodus acutangulus]|uniref:Uncharacterized protein n=1 Tax=Anisodus acutangulus TaxID=402998 RepID=A0A9Q1MHM8_9SOLA|nr:hypothetical protein K7X08_004685 [Anisodus acutangulus]
MVTDKTSVVKFQGNNKDSASSFSFSASLAYISNVQCVLLPNVKTRFYVAPSPGIMGYLAAVERFLKVMAMVWAGSQVTKLSEQEDENLTMHMALALAPFVDRGLSWFTTKMKFESQEKAFAVVAGGGDLPSSSAEGNACPVTELSLPIRLLYMA